MIFHFKIKDLGAKFGKHYKYGSKNHPYRIIKLGHVSEALVVHPTKNPARLPRPLPPRRFHAIYIVCMHA